APAPAEAVAPASAVPPPAGAAVASEAPPMAASPEPRTAPPAPSAPSAPPLSPASPTGPRDSAVPLDADQLGVPPTGGPLISLFDDAPLSPHAPPADLATPLAPPETTPPAPTAPTDTAPPVASEQPMPTHEVTPARPTGEAEQLVAALRYVASQDPQLTGIASGLDLRSLLLAAAERLDRPPVRELEPSAATQAALGHAARIVQEAEAQATAIRAQTAAAMADVLDALQMVD
ncbi:hypothetical protein B7486_69590, partial [cyanobacterium TDX16]